MLLLDIIAMVTSLCSRYEIADISPSAVSCMILDVVFGMMTLEATIAVLLIPTCVRFVVSVFRSWCGLLLLCYSLSDWMQASMTLG